MADKPQETAEMQKGGPAEVSALGLDVTPQTQQAHIADADGTTGGNQTAINAILVVLETFGLTATS